jgi:hypothetical protein
MAQPNNRADALPLLAYKIAPRQFDLSYRFSNISLRDQIVRGQTLVRTLQATGLIPEGKGRNKVPKFDLLICGAGAAGLAAAKEAADLGMSFVLIERDSAIPGGVLDKTADRYVSTAMYEWPHPNHAEHAYPLSRPALLGSEGAAMPAFNLHFTEPVLIKDFGLKIANTLKPDISLWQANFKEWKKGNKSGRNLLLSNTTLSTTSKNDLRDMLGAKVSIHGVPLSRKTLPNITLDYDENGTPKIFEFRFAYVIYAVGFAKEKIEYADQKEPYEGFDHVEFWTQDTIGHPRLGFTKINPRVGILGSGDGALQDALRCLVDPKKFPHPLKIWDGMMDLTLHRKYKPLRDSIHVRDALVRVAAVDGYTTGGAIWSHETHIFRSLDIAFLEIIDDLLIKEQFKLKQVIGAMLRKDVKSVTIITERGYFSKSYALNRFLVLLFSKVLPLIRKKNGTDRLRFLSGIVTKFDQIHGHNRGARIEIKGSAKDEEFDLMIIRGGLNKKETPSELIGLTGQDTGRAELGRIPAPIRPITPPSVPIGVSAATVATPTPSPPPSAGEILSPSPSTSTTAKAEV